jgi:protocatechuate 3,4-dioxygenase beta subunit
MQRKEFLKTLALGSIVPILTGCKSDNDPVPSSETCSVTATETAGPFPTKSPAALVLNDIRQDRTGVEMNVNITVQNKNNNCAALPEAIVDIWHCDKDGYYSEYGGTGMQSANFQSAHFLRGRQTTDANGIAAFKTIFPGWYSGRAPHIHVHIYDDSGKSLLVTQIAFPQDVTNGVYTSATQFYTKGTQDTSNAHDNVFADGTDTELAEISGNIESGFTLAHTIVVST